MASRNMRKSSRRELISTLGHHIDPEKDEQLKKTRMEIDNKASRIMNLIKSSKNRRKKGGNSTNSELVELFEDFHKQYLSLYALHDHLREELIEKVYGREEEEEGSISTSNVDLESFFSADEVSISSSPGHDFLQRASDDFNLKSETTSIELKDLRDKVTSMDEEREALNSEYMASLIKIQESEKIIKDLEFEAEQKECENQKLSGECTQFKEKLAERERELITLNKAHQVQESKVTTRIKKLEAELSSLKNELKKLHSQKRDLEERIEGRAMEAKLAGEENSKMQACVLELERKSQEKEVIVSTLQKKLEENESDSTSKIDKVNQEISEDLKRKLETKTTELQRIQEEKEGLERKVKSLEQKLDSIFSQKTEVKMLMENKNQVANQLRVENDELLVRISQLEKSKLERGNELSAIQAVLQGLENDSSSKIKSSEAEVEKLQHTLKLNLQNMNRKIEETAEHFCKKFEDNIRILSRRIRVAEQLHMENKDIYQKTKEKYEKEHEDFTEMIENAKTAVKRMKKMTFTANEMLDESNASALKFSEQSEHFLNRISKASCEVLFAKDWVRRKNNTIKILQEDADCLLAQMGTKESEILGLRERVWKLENKVRELEKMVKEKEEGMLGLGEEKREAIRQLCVWIDYHRSRSDSLMKILCDMTAARRQKTG